MPMLSLRLEQAPQPSPTVSTISRQRRSIRPTVLSITSFTISSGSFVTNEITIKGVSSRRANDVVEVLQMVKDGRIDVESLITKKYGHEQINEALEDLEHGKLLMGISMWN